MEEHIIASCKKGNRQAQKALFDRYVPEMTPICRRYVKDSHHAEEVLLNGFMKFFSTLDRFEYEDGKSVERWLKRIVVNECFMFLRKRKNLVFVETVDEDVSILDENVLERMDAKVILHHINSLPEGFRLVFNLYIIEGYNHREIAEMLQITEGTSKSQLSRAKTYLQNLLCANEIVMEK